MPSLLDKWLLFRLAVSDRRLSESDRAVLFTLLDMLGQSATAWPSFNTLADKSRRSRRTVIYAVSRLVEYGYLAAGSRRGRGRGNVYIPNFLLVADDSTEEVQAGALLVADDSTEEVQAGALLVADDSTEEVQAGALLVADDSTEEVQAGALLVADDSTEEVQSLALRSAKACTLEVQRLAPNTFTLSRSKKPITGDHGLKRYPETFEAFWRAYPPRRRDAKPKVFIKYQAVLADCPHITWADLRKAAERYSASDDVKNGYACGPLRWFNEQRWARWLDEETFSDSAAAANAGGPPPALSTEEWRTELDEFRKRGCVSRDWPRARLGLPPSNPATRVPPALRREFGFL